MANGRYLPEDSLDLSSFENVSLPSLQKEQLLSILSFASTLAEEAVKHHSKDLPRFVNLTVLKIPQNTNGQAVLVSAVVSNRMSRMPFL